MTGENGVVVVAANHRRASAWAGENLDCEWRFADQPEQLLGLGKTIVHFVDGWSDGRNPKWVEAMVRNAEGARR